MAYVSATPRADFPVNTGWIAAVVARLTQRIERARAYHRTYSELLMMSDRELADIDLSRADLRDVAREAAAQAH